MPYDVLEKTINSLPEAAVIELTHYVQYLASIYSTKDKNAYIKPSGMIKKNGVKLIDDEKIITLKEVDEMGKLKAVYNGFKSRNPEVKAAIEKYYESQVNQEVIV